MILGAVLAVLISGPGRRFLERGVRSLRGRRFGSIARKAYACYQLFRGAKGSLVAFTLLSCIETILPGVEVYFAARALSIDVSLMHFAPLVPVYFFLARLPVAPNIIGIQEGLFVGLFSLVVMLPAQALALALLRRALNLVAVSPGLILYLLDHRKASEMVDRAA